jgi:hypothetical protein
LDEADIQKLFMSVLEDPEQDSKKLRDMFSFMIRSTLKYRDDMLATKGVVVTVEDVRTSLQWLVPVLATGTLPEIESTVSLDLLEIWLKELLCDSTVRDRPRQ